MVIFLFKLIGLPGLSRKRTKRKKKKKKTKNKKTKKKKTERKKKKRPGQNSKPKGRPKSMDPLTKK